MSPKTGLIRIFLFFLALILMSVSAAAQGWTWPEKPQNLKVLPSDWSGERLRPVMTGFTRALGVRCSYCHVGEEGKPLSTYDFVSDEKENKDKAREMLRMLASINDHLSKIEPSGDKRVNMWCHTCHRGRPRPTTIQEELGEFYRASGVDAALAHYKNLKEKYYGRGAYAFTESALNSFGYDLLGSNDTSGAIAVFELNASEYPESGNVWDSLAEGYLAAGNKELAIKYYTKSLELNPRNRNAEEKLKELKGSSK